MIEIAKLKERTVRDHNDQNHLKQMEHSRNNQNHLKHMGYGRNDQNHLKHIKDGTWSPWLKSPKPNEKMGRGRNDRNHMKHTKDGTRSQLPKSHETYKGWDAVAMTEITRNIKSTRCSRHDWNHLKHMGCDCNDWNHLKHKNDRTRSPWPKSPETYGAWLQWPKSPKTYEKWQRRDRSYKVWFVLKIKLNRHNDDLTKWLKAKGCRR